MKGRTNHQSESSPLAKAHLLPTHQCVSHSRGDTADSLCEPCRNPIATKPLAWIRRRDGPTYTTHKSFSSHPSQGKPRAELVVLWTTAHDPIGMWLHYNHAAPREAVNMYTADQGTHKHFNGIDILYCGALHRWGWMRVSAWKVEMCKSVKKSW